MRFAPHGRTNCSSSNCQGAWCCATAKLSSLKLTKEGPVHGPSPVLGSQSRGRLDGICCLCHNRWHAFGESCLSQIMVPQTQRSGIVSAAQASSEIDSLPPPCIMVGISNADFPKSTTATCALSDQTQKGWSESGPGTVAPTVGQRALLQHTQHTIPMLCVSRAHKSHWISLCDVIAQGAYARGPLA